MYTYKPDKCKVPIKVWSERDSIEQGALEQIENATMLPFVYHHAALMPDAHLGYGMPIGGVVALDGVISPHMVGSDIGCFDKDTEFLSPFGWKKISEWTGEFVAQFDPNTNKANFTRPIKYIKESCENFIKIKTKYGVDQMLSENHRCLVYKYDKFGIGSKYDVILAKNLYKKHKILKLGTRYKFLTGFKINRLTSVQYSDVLLRVIVMISADGQKDKNRFSFQFKKQRKIERARQLLNNAGIVFSESKHKNGVIRISFLNMFEGIYLNKGLEKLWNANYDQLKIIVDEILYWDGNKDDNVFFTRKKEEADFIHYAISATGKRGVLRKDKHRDGKYDYRVYQFDNIKVGIAGTPKTKIEKVKSKDGYKYSFTVPSSFLITRRNGNVVVTGNCGMCAVKTSLTEIDKETIKKIFGGSKEYKGGIRTIIPVGFSHHNKKQDINFMPGQGGGLCNFDSNPEKNMPVVWNGFESALKQIGTLGGGNHFIEIQKGSDGHIWIMIHSGSRNLGYKVADYYNKLAIELNEKWHSKVPKEWQLAFLPVDSDEGQAYLKEMQYCVDFAFANRKLMMRRIKNIFAEYMNIKQYDEFMNKDNMINIAHNYASLENHFGKNVWVHRKGATLARKGTIGIIPGSQGTHSYIVEGLGNPESFMSCSHGAGRCMSRTQAKKELNLEEEKEKMDNQGIVHGIRNEGNLDEAPSAYKDIKTVMKNQEDLVKVLVELKPLGVIKG